MIKQKINIIDNKILYNIFDEIKSNLPFSLNYFENVKDFLKSTVYKQDNLNTLILTDFKNRDLFVKKFKLKKKNILFLSQKKILDMSSDYNIFKYPIGIYSLIEKINIQLIKEKYSYLSKIKLNNYDLNLNSKIISNNFNKLKLTEREMDIIVFLNKHKIPKKISVLQNEVWGYSDTLETHTVETHIYRLRKKIKENFNDDKFIVSTDEGYLIK